MKGKELTQVEIIEKIKASMFKIASVDKNELVILVADKKLRFYATDEKCYSINRDTDMILDKDLLNADEKCCIALMSKKDAFITDNKRKQKRKKKLLLGDAVEKITEITGVKAIVKKIFPDCGCEKRKEMLNNLFSPPSIKDMNDEDIKKYAEFLTRYPFEKRQGKIEKDDINFIINLYNSISTRKVRSHGWCSNCPTSANQIKTLLNVLDAQFCKQTSIEE